MKNFFYLVFFLSVIGCSSFDFVYEKNQDNSIINSLNNKMSLSLNGEDTTDVKSLISNKINITNNEAEYSLSLNTAKTSKNIVTESDQTASKIEIKHVIDYVLTNIVSECVIVQRSISTVSTYDSKSSGYSFGSDLSKKEIERKSIEQNLDNFISYVTNNYSSLDC